MLLLACQRPFPAEAGVRLVWGAGVAAAGQPQLVSRREQRFEWKVRPRFLAEFSCERENAQSPCLPLRPLVLRFNAPVPRAVALAARLQPAQGAALAPRIESRQRRWIEELRFAAPLPENARFRSCCPPSCGTTPAARWPMRRAFRWPWPRAGCRRWPSLPAAPSASSRPGRRPCCR